MTARKNHPETASPKTPGRRSLLAAMGAVPVLAATAAVPAAATPAASRTPSAAAGDVIVDPSAARQTIRGFGGMNHTVWIDDLTAAQRDTAFGTGEGQLGFSVLRIPVHENQSDWSGEVATAQSAVAHGAAVIASPWNPPASMVESFSGGRRLRYDMYDAYARYLNDFDGFMRDNGVNLYGISVQNEPDYASDWTAWTSAEIVRFLRENAGSIGTRVIAPESFQYVKSMSDPILDDPQALANLDILGTHLYGTSYQDFPYPLFQQKGAGKELWMTEVYYPNSSDSADLWPRSLDVAEHMHHALVEGQFQAYVWWYIRRSYGPLREDGRISKRGACMAHFARFVRPGHVRLDMTASPQSNVHLSAYRGSGSEVVLVAVNKNSSAVSQTFTLGNVPSGTAESWVTDASRTVAPQGGTGITDGSFTAQLPAQSVTTFVTRTAVMTSAP